MLSAAFRCPACAAPAGSHDISCDTCGLMFSSYVPGTSPPGALAAVCPACARPVGAGERVCPACMTALPLGLKALRLGQPLADGRYTVRQALRRGGMGAIYLAIDHDMFDRVVVVKALLDYLDPADQQAQDRFLHEARTLAELRHPAIPRIYDYFQDHGRNYIVMEHVEGADLEQGLTRMDHDTGMTIAGRAYEQEDVLRWGAAICRVIEYLAARQPHPIVHHDIKPANLLLDRHSQAIRLVDFGTAKGRPANYGGGLGRSSIFGTPGYAAPEQYAGAADPGSDVYALAATLYHLATDDDPREHPFDFLRLAQLGPFGAALGNALELNPARRIPTACLKPRARRWDIHSIDLAGASRTDLPRRVRKEV
jgi:serine/threonine protein kinase